LEIPLHTPETLLKYIGGMHSYLHHSILMFNHTNIDEVSVQATNLESNKGKHVVEDDLEDAHEFEKQSKGKGKSKKTTKINKEEEKNLPCSHCEKKGHDDNHCWMLHQELKPKWGHPRKGKKKNTTIDHDLGSYFEDETKVTNISIKFKSFVENFSLRTSAKSNVIPDGRKRKDMFHLRVVSKNTRIDTLVDSVSQVNLISEQVVQNLGLEIGPHPRPYLLGWIFDNSQVQVDKKCKLRFEITSNFIGEVELYIVPLDICGMVLGSP
jgi:hypothetical protein